MEIEIDNLVNKYLESRQKEQWNHNIVELEKRKMEITQKIAYLQAELNNIEQNIVEVKGKISLEDKYQYHRLAEFEEQERQTVKCIASQPGAKNVLDQLHYSLKRPDLTNNDEERVRVKIAIVEKIIKGSVLSSL